MDIITPNDEEILKLHKKGLINSQIGDYFAKKYNNGLFSYTISNYVYRVIKKYGLKSNKYIFNCLECGKKTKSNTIKSKYCGDRCRYKFHAKKRKKRYKKTRVRFSQIYKQVCKNCGEIFEKTNRFRIYCSKDCRNNFNSGIEKINNKKMLIDNMRFHFYRLKENNYEKAKKIADEMELIEGVKFREFALNGLIEFKNPKIEKIEKRK